MKGIPRFNFLSRGAVLSLAVIGFIGFTMPIFYQLLIKQSLDKVDLSFVISNEVNILTPKRYMLLSGWVTDKGGRVQTSGDASVIALDIPNAGPYQLEVNTRTVPSKSKYVLARVYFNKKFIGSISSFAVNKSEKSVFIVPKEFLSDGFSKVSLVNATGKTYPFELKSIRVTNYKNIPFAFPRGYVFFDTVRWFPNPKEINIIQLLFWASVCILISIAWSALIYLLSSREFGALIILDMLTYLPSFLILSAFYLFSRIFLLKLALSNFDFFFITAGITICCKLIFVLKLTKKQNLLRAGTAIERAAYLLSGFGDRIIRTRIPPIKLPVGKAKLTLKNGLSIFSFTLTNLLLILFVIQIFLCAVLTASGRGAFAERVAISAYISLCVAVFFITISVIVRGSPRD